MPQKRSKPSKHTANVPTPEPIVSTAKPLPASTSNPPKLFVLPKNTSNNARIVTLPNPSTNVPSRYFFCPAKGFYEFTRLNTPRGDCKSWLLTSSDGNIGQDGGETRIGKGYITKSADIFLATPIDILFLILPTLAPKNAKDKKQHFLALDDHVDVLASLSQHWKLLLAHYGDVLRTMIEKRLKTVCDDVDAGEENMYRLSAEKLSKVLMHKAERMVSKGLPKSLEERFIRTALEVPVMSIRREESTLSAVDISSTPIAVDAAESQASDSIVAQSQDTALTTPDDAESKPAFTTPPTIGPLLRLRTSLTYLLASYIPPTLRALLSPQTTSSPIFLPLTTHLSALAALKTEAATLRSISDNVSRKRAIIEDDEKIAEREAKKARKEEEDRKKKEESRGLKALRKVDTSGMKKMSSFFTKVAKK